MLNTVRIRVDMVHLYQMGSCSPDYNIAVYDGMYDLSSYSGAATFDYSDIIDYVHLVSVLSC